MKRECRERKQKSKNMSRAFQLCMFCNSHIPSERWRVGKVKKLKENEKGGSVERKKTEKKKMSKPFSIMCSAIPTAWQEMKSVTGKEIEED